ncbi:MAG: OmpA family protein [Pseudomonadota bacterium]
MLRYLIFAGLVVGLGFAIWDLGQRGARAYERMLAQRVLNGLEILGYSWAEVKTDGLQLELHGHAPDKFERELAFESARATAQVARIKNFATATLAPPERRDPVRIELHRDKRGVTMTGQTASRSMREALNNALKALDAELVVHDLTGIQAALPRRRISPEIRVAALAATRLPNAYVVLEPGKVVIDGQSMDEADREDISKQLLEAAGDQVQLDLRIRIPASVIAPFAFSAEKEVGGGVLLERCAVRNVKERAAVVGRLAAIGIGDRVEPCRIGLGGPSGDWEQAIAVALTALQNLPAGRVDLEYRHLQLTGYPPTAPVDFDATAVALIVALPDGFEAASVLRSDDVATLTSIARERYWMHMSRNGDAVTMAGQVPNAAVASAIDAYATALFGNSSVQSALKPVSASPPQGWQAAALRLLDHLAHATQGEAELAGYKLHLRATLQDPVIAQAVHQDLSNYLGTFDVSTTLTVDLPTVFGGIPLPGVRCAEHMNRVYHDQPVEFSTGSARIAEGNRDVLVKLADVMDRCTAKKIEVGGHTDSQGSDQVNERISQARADAVMSALLGQGVPANRLSAKGYGETIPIADNKTEEGRARNRRIEFKAVE